MTDSPIQITAPMVRFRKYFPVAAWVIDRVWVLLPAFGLTAAVLGIFSIHYGLSVMCIWMGLVCFWVDRKHLNYCLITPLQPMAVILIMSLGAGVSMLIFDSEVKYEYGFLAMQLVGLLAFPIFMAGYWFVTKKIPGFIFPQWRPGWNQHLIKPLILVGWFCLLHELARVLAGIISGSSDRGYAGDFQIETPFGWWSAFGIFLRLQTMGYLMVPMIWRESRFAGRTAVVTLVATTLFLHFVGGSRGAVFFPLFILLIGSYMFLELRRVKYELLLLIGIIGLAPLVTLMGYYRSSQAFRETDIRNVFAKLGTIKEGLARQRDMEEASGQQLSESGRAFIGVADQLIYEMTPDTVPYEGFGRLDGIFWTFIPYILTSGDRPVLQDGNIIVPQYTGYFMERTSIGITWPAELYRRWGWTAVPIGMFLYGLFYGAVFRFAYGLYLFRNALLGFMICGIFFHFFIAWYWHTVLNNFWYWFYDVPKHLVLLGALYLVVQQTSRAKRVPGALKLVSAMALAGDEAEADTIAEAAGAEAGPDHAIVPLA